MTLVERLRGLIAGSVATERLLHDAADEIDRLTAENERLREALNPFARVIPYDYAADDEEVALSFKASDYRTARAALEQP